jgi:hypothetical protein
MKKRKPRTAAEIQMDTRATEAENQWLSAHGLSKELHRMSNAEARARRRSVECPKELKANVRYRRYRDKRLGKRGAASKVRHIDPTT